MDAAATLPSGEKFEGVAGLKAVLLRSRDAFERNLI